MQSIMTFEASKKQIIYQFIPKFYIIYVNVSCHIKKKMNTDSTFLLSVYKFWKYLIFLYFKSNAQMIEYLILLISLRGQKCNLSEVLLKLFIEYFEWTRSNNLWFVSIFIFIY